MTSADTRSPNPGTVDATIDGRTTPAPEARPRPATTVVNGVDTALVDGLVRAYRDDPATGPTPFSARVDWLSGYRTRAVGGDHAPVAGDEPIELGGTGTAPAPEELLLAAVGQCLTVGIVGAAAARGLQIDALSVTADGAVDLAAAYGVGDGHPGFQSVALSVHLEADADRDELERLIQSALSRAPIPTTVARPVPVTASLR